ncbi:hypothetical protein [Modestobacter altitudinis]|uniref:hypothetical protein n=1 Tax=Modestobacter altitudinis TaxID=2213158 RepID=UPI00110CDF87|nr:hypothetical protein [Modestobacter altitudinis]
MVSGWRKVLEGLGGSQAAPVLEALLQPEREDRIIVAFGVDLPEPADGELDRGFEPEDADNPVTAFVSASPLRLRRQLTLHSDATAFVGVLPMPLASGPPPSDDALLVLAEAVAVADRPLQRAVVAVPYHVISSARMEQLRTRLLDLVHVSDVIRVPWPSGLLGQQQVLLRLEPRMPSDAEPTRFASLTRDNRQGTRLADVLRTARGGAAPATQFSEGFSARLPAGAPWVEEALHPERLSLIEAAHRSARNVPLSELATVRSGRPAGRAEAMEPMLAAKAVAPALPDLASLPIEPVAGRATRLQGGDIVGRDMRPYVWAVVPAELDGVVAGNGTLVVRPEDPAMGDYLVAFLRSSVASRLLPPMGTVMPRLRRADLEALPVPYTDIEMATKAAAHASRVLKVREQVLNIVEDLNSALDDAFTTSDGAEVAARVAQVAERATVTEQALLRQEEPTQSYQDVYPHPIARSLRQMKLVEDPLQRYDASVRAAEALLATLGAVAAASAVSSQLQVTGAADWFSALDSRGLSPGHWLKLLRDVGEASRRADLDPFGVGEATRSRRNKGLLRDLDALVEIRNGVAHRRGPRTAAAAAEQLPELEDLLNSALAGSALLSQMQWFLVERADWERRQRWHIVKALSLMGDHPDFERAEFGSTEPLEPGLLYGRLSSGRLLLLDPFVAILHCPSCQHAELYYPDRQHGGSTRLMNLSTTHSIDSERLARDLDTARRELTHVDNSAQT